MSFADTVAPQTSSFSLETAEVVSRLRSAITKLFREQGGIRKTYDAQKFLGVDTRLSWQLFKLAGPGDSLSLAPHVPTPAGIKRLLQASRSQKIDPALLDDIRNAHEQFERIISQHAGDRTSFDSMTRAYAKNDDAQQSDMLHRKSIFKGYSHFLGTQMETFLVTMFVYPGSKPGLANFAVLRGQYGLRRLRPDADLIVDSSKIAGTPRLEMLQRTTFDPAATEKFGATIIPQFCSQPLPTLHSSLHEISGQTNVVLTDELLGRKSAADMVFGNIYRDNELVRTGDDPLRFGPTIRIRHPSELLISDVFIHRDTFPHVSESVRVMAHAAALSDNDVIHDAVPALPFSERVVSIDSTIDSARIREIPNYPDMLEYATHHIGHRFEEFDGFRLRMEYPLIDSMVAIWFNILD